jgi:SAM-dependent methyltransferase
MNQLYSGRLLCVVLVLTFFVTGVCAQAQQESGFQPTVGQPGKDVVWVPTQQDLVDKMLDLAKITPQDYVIDLGSGDGRTVITAAKRGARALGIEYNPDMVELSRQNAAKEGMGEKAVFIQADLFETDFSKGTVLTLFLLPDINIKLRPKILAMKPGTRVVSNSFTMDDWESDDTIRLENNCSSWCTAYLWIVPAKMDGKWNFADGDELTIVQNFQKISGSLFSGGKKTPVEGKVTGDRFNIAINKIDFAGEIQGNILTLKSNLGDVSRKATRAVQ